MNNISNNNTPLLSFEVASFFHSCGINVIPVNAPGPDVPPEKEKAPRCSNWAPFKHRRQTPEDLATLFADPCSAYGVITGEFSRNLVAIDFDLHDPSDPVCYDEWLAKIPADLSRRLIIETSRSGRGRHVYVRLQHVPGKKEVLAKTAEDHTLIELISDGFYIIASPSVGQRLLQGDFTTIPTLTDEEFDLLVTAARSFDQRPANVEEARERVHTPAGLVGTRPGDRYNVNGADHFAGVLVELGWQRIGGDDKNQYWRRPGKTEGGNSASLRFHEGRWWFCNFSTSTPHLDTRGHSIFDAYARMVHAGDYTAAARTLASEGFGEPVSAPVAVEVITESRAEPSESRTETSEPPPVTHLPYSGVIGHIADLTNATSPRVNPTLAWAGGLSVVSLLASASRFQSEFGDCPNLSLLVTAESGVGKNAPQRMAMAILHALGMDDYLYNDIGSGAGLEDAIVEAPLNTMLAVVDEFHHFVGRLNGRDNAAAKATEATLLRMITSAGGYYRQRCLSRRGQRGNTSGRTTPLIANPHLVLLAFAISKFLFEQISSAMLCDGLIGRFTLFEEPCRGKPNLEMKPLIVPEALLNELSTIRSTGGYRYLPPSVPPPARIVRCSEEACRLRLELIEEAERRYASVSGGDEIAQRALNGRLIEHTMQLALNLAISDRPGNPEISKQNLEGGWAIAEASATRIGWLAESYTAGSTFDARTKKFIRLLREAKDNMLPRWMLLKRLAEPVREFNELVDTLEESGRIRVVAKETAGRKATLYRLAE